MKKGSNSGLLKTFGPILGFYSKNSPRNSWSPHFMITPWNQKSRNAGTSCITNPILFTIFQSTTQPECLEKTMQPIWIFSSMQLLAEFLTKNLLPWTLPPRVKFRSVGTVYIRKVSFYFLFPAIRNWLKPVYGLLLVKAEQQAPAPHTWFLPRQVREKLKIPNLKSKCKCI